MPLSRASRRHRPARLARAFLACLVAAIVVLPIFALHSTASAEKCGPKHFCPKPSDLDVPACDAAPGLADPPPFSRPLDADKEPIVEATRAGTLPGHGEVTPTGDYVYRLPIEVPEGRAGMQPSLALAYSSRGSNGYLGVGFHLEGLSEISRCPKTLATEGKADGVHFEESDAYCLDGHKLVAVPGDGSAGGAEYRTEDETFTRIVSVVEEGRITRFRAFLKGGRIRTYEGLQFQHDKAPRSFTFLLAEETDRAGNAIRYAYGPSHDPSKGGYSLEYYPTQIDYTFQTAAPAEPARRSVRFVYEDRPDILAAAFGDRGTQVKKRLKAIELYAPSPTEPLLAWRYDLTYKQSRGSGRSLLQAVYRCGALGGCLPGKVFSWEETDGPHALGSPAGRGPERRWPRRACVDDGQQALAAQHARPGSPARGGARGGRLERR